MCAPASPEQMRQWLAERVRREGVRKLEDAKLFGTAFVEKIDVSFESRSYEQRFLQHVRRQRQRELV